MKNIYLFIFTLCAGLSLSTDSVANGIVCNVTVDDAHCSGLHGGAIIDVSGGTAPYTYNWSNGSNTNAGVDLNSGIYTVTVTDATGCTSECMFTIPANPPRVTLVCGDNELEAVVENATPPYTYEWTNGSTAPSIFAANNEFYSVIVTDAEGCDGNAGMTYSEATGFSCRNQIVLSLTGAPSGNGNGTGKIYLPSLLETPYATCDVDYQMKVEDVDGEEVLPFTSDFLEFDCSLIGDYIFIVMDMVSGESCSGNLTVEDKLAPVAVCSTLSWATLEDGEVELAASFFDGGSRVTCGDIRFTFSDTPPDQDPAFDPAIGASKRIFTCADYFASNGLVDVTIFVWDEDNEFSSCFTDLTLNNEIGNPCDLDGEYVRVTQGVCNANPQPQYDILMNQSIDINVASCLGLIPDGSLEVGVNTLQISDNNTDGVNGISTLDIVTMMGGLSYGMGTGGFNSPVEAIAMDIDNDGAISTLDLLETRRQILGMSTLFDQQEDYKIVLTNTDFGPDFNPFDMGTNFTTLEFLASDFDGSFLEVTVIKNGDVNFTAFLTSEEESEVRSISLLHYSDKFIKAGQTKVIEFNLEATTDIKATTFKLSGQGLSYDNLDAFGQDVIINYQNGDAFISFINFNEAETNFEFSLEVTADMDVRMSDAISLAGSINEVVSSASSIEDISLSANASTSSENIENISMSIFPNPAQNVINITFDQAMDREVQLFSLSGQTFGTIESNDSSLTLDVAEMNDGIYFLHVNSAAGSQIQKILIQK